jgi:DNA (cytosine-5)-methyltransferase 3A
MNILSLFDGISCGMVALERAKIKVYNYFASEIDKHAQIISQNNYPDVERIGDVRFIETKDLPKINLLIGGSPCQGFSFAGKQKGMVTSENIQVESLEQYLELKQNGFEFEGQSYLFWEYVRILKEVKPKYFLLENVRMKKNWEGIISKTLGVQPVMINSNLVSAQERKRLYWTNISQIEQPKNKFIMLNTIIDGDFIVDREKSLCLRKGGSGGRGLSNKKRYFTKSLGQFKFNSGFDFSNPNYDWMYSFSTNELEKLQTLPVGYCDGVSYLKAYESLGNSWTVDVIAHIFSYLPEEYKLR